MRSIYENRYLILGVLGALVVLYGTSQQPPQLFYISGAIALLATATHYRLLYFIALELILIAGHTAVLLNYGLYLRFAVPILLSLQLLIFFVMFTKENLLLLLLGICGIAALSIGFSYSYHWIFFTGSSLIAVYSYYLGAKGNYPAFIWAILNTLFSLLSLIQIFG